MKSALDSVRNAAQQEQRWRESLVVAIRRAREEGKTLRAIAEAAGMSHEQVRRIGRGG